MKKLAKLDVAEIADLWRWEQTGDLYMVVEMSNMEVCAVPLHLPGDRYVKLPRAEFYDRFKKVG